MFRAMRCLCSLVRLALLLGVSIHGVVGFSTLRGCVNGLVNGEWPCSKVELMGQVPNEDTGPRGQ